MKKIILAGFVSIFCFTSVFLTAFAQNNFTFSRNLTVGDEGSDVLALQKLLNSQANSKIASIGPGSPGNETTYFGNLTKNAVIRFQETYRQDILVKASLTSGTGFVGSLTRIKLNELNAKTVQNNSNQIIEVSSNPASNMTANNQTINNQVVSTSNSNEGYFDSPLLPIEVRNFLQKVKVYGVTPYKLVASTTITIQGTGFMPTGNTVYIGNAATLENISSADGTTIKVTVPSSISLGTYEIGVSNVRGKSEVSGSLAKITVGNTAANVPVINTVSPAEATLQDTVTLTGTGFNSNNTIATSIGILEGVASLDGKTLTFSLSSFQYQNIIKDVMVKDPGTKFSMPIMVGNENGMTPTASFIIVK